MQDIIIMDGVQPKESELKSQNITVITAAGASVPVEMLSLCSGHKVTVQTVADPRDEVAVAFRLGQVYAAGDKVFTSSERIKKAVAGGTAKTSSRRRSKAAKSVTGKSEEEKTGSSVSVDLPRTVESKTAEKKSFIGSHNLVDDKRFLPVTENKNKPSSQGEDSVAENAKKDPSPAAGKKPTKKDFFTEYTEKGFPAEHKKEAGELFEQATNKMSLTMIAGGKMIDCDEDVKDQIIALIAEMKRF